MRVEFYKVEFYKRDVPIERWRWKIKNRVGYVVLRSADAYLTEHDAVINFGRTVGYVEKAYAAVEQQRAESPYHIDRGATARKGRTAVMAGV